MDAPGPGAESSVGVDSVLRNAGFSLATQLLTAGFTAGLTVFLARRLGAESFGTFSLALGIGALVLLPVDFGVSASVGRFAAECRGNLAALRPLLADALRLKLLLAVPASVGLAALSAPIAHAYGTPGLVWPLRGVSIAVFGQSLMVLYQGSFAALGRIRPLLRIQVVESVTETGASVALVILGGGATGAAFGRGAGYLVGGVFCVFVAARLLGNGVLPRHLRGSGRTRAIATYAWPLLIVNSAFTLFGQIDVLLIGALRSAADVGLFQAPLRLAAFLQYPGIAVANAVAPRMVGDDEPAAARARFQAALRGLILLFSAVVGPLVVWAGPLVRVGLGDEYAGSAAVLRALVPFVFLSGFGPLVSVTLSYIGQARKRVPVALAAVALNAAIDAVLIPRIGIVGGAIGTDVAFALYVLVHLMICRRELKLDLRPVALTFLRSVLAAATMTAVLGLIGIDHLSLLDWLAGGLAGLASFAAVLIATREVGMGDLRRMAPLLRSRRG